MKSAETERTHNVSPKTVLNEFYNLCVEARCDFDLYRSLFEADPKSTKLYIDYAPYFFNDFGRIITRALVLHVCKLTDPARSSGQGNLTTNYILEELPWPYDVKDQLASFNRLLMDFRKKIERARNKRIAHTDMHSQVTRLEAMGRFDQGEDAVFFTNLQSFFDVAYRHVHGGRAPPIGVGGHPDSHKIMHAIEKAIH